MKIMSVIVLERDDRYILRHLEHAANLAGIAEFDTKEMREIRETDLEKLSLQQRSLFLALRSLRLISNDKFTMDDVRRASDLIRELVSAKLARADSADRGAFGPLFVSKEAEQNFLEGVRATANLALRELDSFLEALADLREEALAA